jgi:hypothetical protein
VNVIVHEDPRSKLKGTPGFALEKYMKGAAEVITERTRVTVRMADETGRTTAFEYPTGNR